MTTAEALREIRHSPQLPEYVRTLQTQLEEEQKRRNQFYRDMTPEQKVEFIDGEVIMHSPAKNRHLDVTGNIFSLLKTFVSIHQLGTVKAEKCLTTFPRNDYEPDVVFFGKEKSASLSPNTMKFPIPDLVVEVLSPSTEARDRGVKFEDYAAHGVAEYWIIDPDQQVIEQYLLEQNSYQLRLKSDSGFLQSQVIANLKVPIESLFNEQKNLATLRELMS